MAAPGSKPLSDPSRPQNKGGPFSWASETLPHLAPAHLSCCGPHTPPAPVHTPTRLHPEFSPRSSLPPPPVKPHVAFKAQLRWHLLRNTAHTQPRTWQKVDTFTSPM